MYGSPAAARSDAYGIVGLEETVGSGAPVISKPDFVRNVLKIYRGTHLSHPKIELVRAASVEVRSEQPLPLELDGEQPGTTPASFEIVPWALRLRVP